MYIDYSKVKPYKFFIVSPSRSFIWATCALNKKMADRLASRKCKDEYWRSGELHGYTFIDNTPCNELEQLTQHKKKNWIPMYAEIKKPG